MATAIKRRSSARVGLWLALAALLLQVVLPAVHYAGGVAPDRVAFETAHSLCLAPGAVPPTQPDKAPVHKSLPCPICQTFQLLGAGFIPPSTVAIPLPQQAGSIVHHAFAALMQPRRRYGDAQARAPPTFI
jgi:hypothetical protein